MGTLPSGRTPLLALAACVAACAASSNRPLPTVLPRTAPTPEAGAAGGPGGSVEGTTAVPPAPISEPAPSSAKGPDARTAPAGAEAEGAGPARTTSTPNTAGDAEAADEVSPSPTVARVGGTRVELAELLDAWMRNDPSGMRSLLDDLVLSRIVLLEAVRLGAALPDGVLAEAVAKRRAGLEAEAQRKGEKDLEALIANQLGIAPKRYFAGLERELAVDLTAKRVVRGWLLTSERAEVRMITVDGADARDRVQAKLAAGQPFADVARELSTGPTREEGGRMTPVVRGPSSMSNLAFATDVGKVAGPVAGNDTQYHFLLVEARPTPNAEDWATLGPEVERSLAERKIEDNEFLQWQQVVLERYEIDLGPFRALLEGRP
jgi:hypothetical protein